MPDCAPQCPFCDPSLRPSLSQGVSFEQKLVEVGPQYISMYNKSVDVWYDTLLLLKEMKGQDSLLVTYKVRAGKQHHACGSRLL